ncbi:hypothetical protein A3F06_03275 [candidate division TM6 bacterium RIFCSPHIGHO2_12_FULL_36_22]|nr:MAG: hypothetical protein A3F06_03275 [candidate division TM6 bacterium RIFCSPHIGHO2_12_FULL_36_22]
MKFVKGLMLVLCLSVVGNTSVYGMRNDSRSKINANHILSLGFYLGMIWQIRQLYNCKKAIAILSAELINQQERAGKEEVKALQDQLVREKGIALQLRQILAEQGGVFKKQEEVRANDQRESEAKTVALKLALAEETNERVRLQKVLEVQQSQAVEAA